MFYFTVTKVDEGGAKIFDNGKVVEKQTTMFVMYPKPRYNGCLEDNTRLSCFYINTVTGCGRFQ